MRAMMDDVRDRGLKVTPICGYAATWLRRNRDTHDLVV
jgi:predicted GNAT family acetyltransferase